MKGLLLLANGFEDNEALTTRDVLLRANLSVTTASIDDDIFVVSSHDLLVKSDALLKDIAYKDFDFLILPGGGKGTINLKNSSLISEVIRYFMANSKLVGAICAAPGVLGRLGYLKGHNYTCFKGCEDGEGENTKECVVCDKNIITARSMYYSIDFALAIIEYLLGKEKKEEIYLSLLGK